MHRPLLALGLALPALGLALSVGAGTRQADSVPASLVRLPPFARSGGPKVVSRGAHQRADLQGIILAVEASAGRLLLDVQGKERLLLGSPPQLLGLAPGDTVRAPVRSYGSRLWLFLDEADAHAAERFTTHGLLSGAVVEVRSAEGTFEVGGESFLAHPALLAPLAPGLRVQVRFALVGGARWALAVETDHVIF
jgi:hypothetical protein